MNDEDKKMILDTAMEAGHILLENGAEISRVEETMDRICTHYGESEGSFFVLSNGIFTTSEDRFAKVRHIPVKGTQLNKVAAVNQLSREMSEGRYTVEELSTHLKEVRSMPGKTPHMQILASGVGAGAFCYLFGGTLYDSAAAFVAGLILWVFFLYVAAPHMSRILGNAAGGALVTFLCLLFCKLGFGTHMSYMIIGSVIPLVPGVPFVNGIRDIADGDYIAGMVRLLDAVLIFLCIAVGVGVTFILYNRITGGAIL